MTKFDIIIPTYNRSAELVSFFENNKSLQRNDVHLWLVDDCSNDFDIDVVPQWSNITLIRLEKNMGQAYARNVAIAKGSAPYVVSLDDDAWFLNADEALPILDTQFIKFVDAGCIMFNVATPDSSFRKTGSGTILPHHITCACAYRRETLSAIGNFSGFLHSGAEESDVSLRLYAAGYVIRFSEEIKVFHNFTPLLRSKEWYLKVRYNTTRNDLLIVVMRYPIVYVFPFIAGKYLNHLKFAIKNRTHILSTIIVTVKAGFGFIGMINEALQRRNPLTVSRFKLWRSIK